MGFAVAGLMDPYKRIAADVLLGAVRTVQQGGLSQSKNPRKDLRDAVNFLRRGCAQSRIPLVFHEMIGMDWLADLNEEQIIRLCRQGIDYGARRRVGEPLEPIAASPGELFLSQVAEKVGRPYATVACWAEHFRLGRKVKIQGRMRVMLSREEVKIIRRQAKKSEPRKKDKGHIQGQKKRGSAT